MAGGHRRQDGAAQRLGACRQVLVRRHRHDPIAAGAQRVDERPFAFRAGAAHHGQTQGLGSPRARHTAGSLHVAGVAAIANDERQGHVRIVRVADLMPRRRACGAQPMDDGAGVRDIGGICSNHGIERKNMRMG